MFDTKRLFMASLCRRRPKCKGNKFVYSESKELLCNLTSVFSQVLCAALNTLCHPYLLCYCCILHVSSLLFEVKITVHMKKYF